MNVNFWQKKQDCRGRKIKKHLLKIPFYLLSTSREDQDLHALVLRPILISWDPYGNTEGFHLCDRRMSAVLRDPRCLYLCAARMGQS